jgi:5'(3')-deoxyribonucleotidase
MGGKKLLMIIHLDMDGVVSDAHHAFCHAIGRPELLDNWPAGEFQVYRAAGISEIEMWKMVDDAGFDLWANMRVLPWAHRLYNDLCGLGKVMFTTLPSYDPMCAAGKMKWLQDFTGHRDFRDFSITPRKELLAGPDRLLIDDYPSNCDKFHAEGGRAILFPARWSGYTEDAIEQEIDTMLSVVRIAAAEVDS